MVANIESSLHSAHWGKPARKGGKAGGKGSPPGLPESQGEKSVPQHTPVCGTPVSCTLPVGKLRVRSLVAGKSKLPFSGFRQSDVEV